MADLDWTPVVSSHVARYAYDAPARTLHVEYSDGSLYQFLNVPASVPQVLEHVDSVGAYLHRALRVYKYTKVRARKA